MLDVPGAVYVLWIIALVVVLLVVPIAVYYLHRLLTDGLRIKRYTAEMLTAGLGIAGNTQHIVALEDTIQVATGILNRAGAINEHSGAIENLLASRAASMSDGHTQ
ncbi:MAG TPA: hypothetical protein VKR83_05845 [Ktedonobacteraceae bacterium]|nr:hypothetical protein [Ktedonobacteraceae bacterium]